MRILVTGSEGLVGGAVLRAGEKSDDEVAGLSHADCELRARDATRVCLHEARPDVVIHAAGNVDGGACERDPVEAHRCNVQTTQNVALACAETGAALIYVSANLVFDGSLPHPALYLEHDPPCPSGVFAHTKRAGEALTRTLVPRSYVARTSWVFGPRPRPGRPDFVSRVVENARKGEALSMLTDLWATPTCVDALASALLRLAHSEAYGTYHLVNDGAASPAELAREALAAAGIDAPIEEGTRPGGPSNTALRNLLAAENLGIRLGPWREAVQAWARAL